MKERRNPFRPPVLIIEASILPSRQMLENRCRDPDGEKGGQPIPIFVTRSPLVPPPSIPIQSKNSGKEIARAPSIDVWRETVTSPSPLAEACNPAKNGEARGVPVRYSRTLTTWGSKMSTPSSFVMPLFYLFVFN
ncbi:hypothetical protein TNCV_1089031 [Trichonephila clavipes]|uniref:Uncharacterized protein n=1 Tax=Trichonephila clavipes TaxID=2585209 RepID=A0A8X6SX76_TRICX|nr:hypothetical protein TNCV_1089031 [Trichonephila clavipes]